MFVTVKIGTWVQGIWGFVGKVCLHPPVLSPRTNSVAGRESSLDSVLLIHTLVISRLDYNNTLLWGHS